MIKKAAYQKIAVSFLFIITLLFTAYPHFVHAEGAMSSGIGFSVRAILPENQLSLSTSYFDLRMTPGQTQELSIEIENETDAEITVDLDSISASTSSNGVIDYKTPDVKDSSLKIPFSTLTTINQKNITIPPKSTAPVTFTVAMPGQSYDGAILGGIIITKNSPSTSGTTTGGAAIQNIYSYVIGVKLTETDTPIKPTFELFGVKAGAVNYNPAIVHFIRNKEAVVVKNMSLNVTTTSNNTGEVVAKIKKTGIDMAPNSIMELAVTLLENEEGTPLTLQSGSYTSKVTLAHEGGSWDFEDSFEIDNQQVTSINDQANPGAKPTGIFCDFPWWLILLIVIFGILLVFIFLFLLILLLKRRKKDKEDRRKYIHERKRFSNRNPPK